MNPTAVLLPTTEPLTTLGTAREKLRGRLAAGKASRCPCCGGVSKVYARSIYAKMVAALAAIARTGTRGLAAFEVLALPHVGGGDYAKLVHWGVD